MNRFKKLIVFIKTYRNSKKLLSGCKRCQYHALIKGCGHYCSKGVSEQCLYNGYSYRKEVK